MDGITIINTEEIFDIIYPNNWLPIGMDVVAWIIFFIGLCIALYVVITHKLHNSVNKRLILPLLLTITGTVLHTIAYGIASQMEGEKVPTGRYRYTCTISDDVSFNEIAENYNLIEYDKGICILEDK